MFGAECLLAEGRMFAFSYENGLVVKLSDERYREALALPGVQPFIMRGVPFGRWARFPDDDPSSLLPWLRAAYDHVLGEPPARRHSRRQRSRGGPR
jgi:TfoX/Sxy family transcriptional regulator of competence genes